MLDVHAAALGAVLGPADAEPDESGETRDPVLRLLQHERRNWAESAVAAQLPDPHRERLAVVVAVGTMYGGSAERFGYQRSRCS
ncbi:hypothetical protein BJF78_12195 [Pseudonocardia sp. CNS-139]|nr:hypothetical protein BJF78_12195 [Pseudonocardia sp. CNS-139]